MNSMKEHIQGETEVYFALNLNTNRFWVVPNNELALGNLVVLIDHK
jgi:hypothetical protein